MAVDKIIQYPDLEDEVKPPLFDLYNQNGKFRSIRRWLRKTHADLFGAEVSTLPLSTPESKSTLERPPVQVNAGRWVWICPRCYEALIIEHNEIVYCPYELLEERIYYNVHLPNESDQIEEELLRQPGHRLNAAVRHWRPGWTLEYLQARTAKANQLQAENPGALVRALSVGATRVWVTGEVATAGNFNLYLSTVIDDLAGRNGMVEFEDSVRVNDGLGHVLRLPGGTTSQRPSTPAVGDMRYNSTVSQIEWYAGSAWNSPTAYDSLLSTSYTPPSGSGNATTLLAASTGWTGYDFLLVRVDEYWNVTTRDYHMYTIDPDGIGDTAVTSMSVRVAPGTMSDLVLGKDSSDNLTCHITSNPSVIPSISKIYGVKTK